MSDEVVIAFCPECGESFDVYPARRGRTPTYCSRACQVRNLRRRRAGGRTITITTDEETCRLLDQAASRHVVSTQRYVELVVAKHADLLASGAQPAITDSAS
jgi:endogenous inhibitor of DNA gyrase (YacG/DUF329 family)